MNHAWNTSFFAAGTIAGMLWGAPAFAEVADVVLPLRGNDVRLRNVATGLCIALTEEHTVRTLHCSADVSRRWNLMPLRNGMTQIRSWSPGRTAMCLHHPPAPSENDPLVSLAPCFVPQSLTLWAIPFFTDPARICVPDQTPMLCLESGEAGEPLRLRRAGSGADQLWQAVP